MTLASYTPTDVNYDYAVGGLPFLSAIGHRLGPYTVADLKRQTAPYRKDQTDQANEVGEQSLSFWWLRSQSSFHSGAGQKFLDGNGDDSVSRHTRFEQSRGVDVFTVPGQVTVLPKLTQKTGTSAGLLIRANNGVMYSAGTSIKYVSTLAPGLVVPTAVNDIGTGNVYSLVSDGTYYYSSRDSGVYRGLLTAPATASVQVYATTQPLTLGYVDARLMAAGQGANSAKLYELTATATAAALPTAFYTHPDVNTSWSGFTFGPQGIYVATTDGANTSCVFRIGISTASGTPMLSAPLQILEMAPGEHIAAMLCYLGAFLVVQTNMGIRVGTLQSDGSVTMGPLTVDKTSLLGVANNGYFTTYASGLAGQDSSVYAITRGSAPSRQGDICLLRIDLSNEIASGRYAWSSDRCADHLAPPSFGFGVVFDLNRQAIIGTDAGLYMEDSTAPEDLAFLVTSRIRYSTSEPKIFERVRTEGDAPSGADGHHVTGGNGLIRTLLVDSNGNYALTYGEWAPGEIFTKPVTGELYSVSSNEFRVEDEYLSKVGQYVQVQIDFTESSNGVALPDIRLRGYQLKALPGQKRQRVIQVPLQCFDDERDQGGQRRGGQSTAWSRLKALEALEESGTVVRFQQFGPGFTSTDDMNVVVDDISFVQTGSPNSKDAWGGVILATLRTVD